MWGLFLSILRTLSISLPKKYHSKDKPLIINTAFFSPILKSRGLSLKTLQSSLSYHNICGHFAFDLINYSGVDSAVREEEKEEKKEEKKGEKKEEKKKKTGVVEKGRLLWRPELVELLDELCSDPDPTVASRALQTLTHRA